MSIYRLLRIAAIVHSATVLL